MECSCLFLFFNDFYDMIKERMEATTDQKILKKLTICVKNVEFERNDRMFAYGVPARLLPLNGAPYSAGLQRTY